MTDPKPETGYAYYNPQTGERLSAVYRTPYEAVTECKTCFAETGAMLRTIRMIPVTITPDESEK